MRKFVGLSLLTAIAVGAVWAQGLTGTISGIVKDPNGAVVPNARVSAKNAGTNAEAATQTDAEGYYRIANLVSGNYFVSAEAAPPAASS